MKRTKKRLKIKWKNIALLIVLLMCAYIVGHDVFMLTIYSWVTGNSCGWTWFGFITFILSCAVLGEVVDYISEEFKK